MRTSRTVGFAIDESDQPRLERLTTIFGHGNRSAFLRQAMDVMEKLELAQRLCQTQAYGEQRLVERGVDPAEIPDLVRKALEHPDPEVIAEAKLIVSGVQRRRRAERSEAVLHPVAEIATELLRAQARS